MFVEERRDRGRYSSDSEDSARDRWPAWSTDGTVIAFTSNRDGNNEIYVMNADGSGLTNVTNHPASDTSPAWTP